MIELDQGEITRDRWGRPRLPDLGTLTRTSTLAKTLDDQSSLSAWKARKAIVGVASVRGTASPRSRRRSR